MPAPQKNSHTTLIVFIAVAGVCAVALGVFNGLSGPGEFEAKVEAQMLVKKYLDRSADFSVPVAEKVTTDGARAWRVFGYATTRNAFNAEVRHEYVVIFKIAGSSLNPESVVVDGKQFLKR